MKSIYSNILIFLFLFISLAGLSDWYIESIVSSGANNGMERVWIKDSFYKSETERYSVFYNSTNDSLRIENHIIKSYWEGSYSEWKSTTDPEPHKAGTSKKKKKKGNKTPKNVIQIKPMNDSVDIVGLIGQRYLITVNGKPVEEFFFAKTTAYNNLNLIRIDSIKNYISPSKFKYRQSEEYYGFIKKGIILKRMITDEKGLTEDELEIISVQPEEIDPVVFNVPDGYQPLPLEQITKELSSDTEPAKIDE